MKKKVVMLAFVSVLLLSMIIGAKFITFCSNGSSTITVVAVQPEFYFFDNATNYRTYMTEMMEQAMIYGPDLVLFPEDIGTLLLTLQYPEITQYETVLEAMVALGMYPNEAFYGAANVAGTAYLNTFSTLAVQYNVYIIAGSIMLPDGEITGTPGNYTYNKTGTVDKVYNIAYFFDPDGHIIGTQKKVHLISLELNLMHLAPSTEETLQVYGVDIRGIHVGVGIAVCADGFYESVGQILAQKGADIIFQPTFNPYPLNDYEHNFVRDSVWTRSQNQLVYGVLSCLVGQLLDFTFTGKSAITAPIELTESGDGIISMAEVFNSSTVIHGVLDIQALHELRAMRIGDINIDRIVNIQDVVIAALAFGSRPEDPNWNPKADFNGDSIINIIDLVFIGINFGKRW